MNYSIECVGNKLTEEYINFIETHHYSKTARNQKPIFIFTLKEFGKLIGIALFGQPIGKNVKSCYGENTIELRRFVLIDQTQKNAESWFLSRCLKYLKQNTQVNKVVSYSDPNYGHQGIIYKATNFKFIGQEKTANPREVIYRRNKYHMREVYQKYQGKYTPKSREIQKAIQEGKAKIKKLKKKLVYLYNLRK